MVDYCVPEDGILRSITGVTIENKLPQPFLMWAKRSFSIRRKRANTGPKQDAEVEELERGVVYGDPQDFICTPRVGQRLRENPLSAEWLLEILIEVLFACFAEQMLADTLLQRFPATITSAVDSHHVVLVHVMLVVEFVIKKLWNDV